VNIVSFVDRDMVMRYFGGGIGHLKNAPPLQVLGFGPIGINSEEMPVDDDDGDPFSRGDTIEDLGTIVQQPSKDVVNGDDEDEDHDEEDDDDSDGDEDGDQTDEDEDEEGEDDYGYASA
jgi:hypothetical protein